MWCNLFVTNDQQWPFAERLRIGVESPVRIFAAWLVPYLQRKAAAAVG